MMETVNQIQEKIGTTWKEIVKKGGIVENLTQDLEKFSKGNQIAGTRARKGLQFIKNASKDLRKWIQEVKNKKE